MAEHWAEKDGVWSYRRGDVKGVLLPVGDIGWEARACTPTRRMRTGRHFTAASAKKDVEQWAEPRPEA